jgi:NAD(P)-dependent dehydrogenase (short-subunit alcohol dehydrogenase family)
LTKVSSSLRVDLPASAGEVVAQIKALGGKVVADSGSVTGPDARTDLVTCTVPRFGRLDTVVNDAG